MSQEPQTISEAHSGAQAMSVVDRVALRLFRVKIYGTNEDEQYAVTSRKQWDRVLDEDEREAWRRAARQVMADLAWSPEGTAESIEVTESTNYQLHGPGDRLEDWYGDISEIVADHERHPGSRMFERKVLTTVVRGEWAEVPA